MKIIGTAAIVTSTINLHNIEAVKKFDPQALVAKDDKGNELFRIDIGRAALSPAGACFPTKDNQGNAQLTLTLPENLSQADDKIESVFTSYGKALQNLTKYEPIISEQINKALATVDTIKAGITVE